MIAHAIKKLYLRYPRYSRVWIPPPYFIDSAIFIRAIFIESNYTILQRECEATFSYLLMCFVPQFATATCIITLESVIFPMRFCVGLLYIKKFIVSSSNNIFYIQIHHFTKQTMLNQQLHYTIYILNQSLNQRGDGWQPPLLGSRCHNKQLGSLKVNLQRPLCALWPVERAAAR